MPSFYLKVSFCLCVSLYYVYLFVGLSFVIDLQTVCPIKYTKALKHIFTWVLLKEAMFCSWSLLLHDGLVTSVHGAAGRTIVVSVAAV